MMVVMVGMTWGRGVLITYLTAKVLIDPVTTIKTDMKILNCGESTFIKLNIVKRNDQ